MGEHDHSNISVEEYERRCGECGGDDLPVWLSLHPALAHRDLWYFYDPDDTDSCDQLWCYGLAGEARLTVTVVDGAILLYVYEEDRQIVCATAEQMLDVLPPLEARYEGLSPTARRLMGDVLPFVIDEWATDD